MSSQTGKVVFITGAAGGVGAEVAQRLHRKGTNLMLVDLDETPLKALAARLGEDRVMTSIADVRDLTAMQTAVDRAVDRFGGVDVVMANAGIATYGSVLQVDPEAFKTLIDVNVVGVFNTVRAALPAVINSRGYVLIVSSVAAYAAAPGMAPYDASKAAVEQFANALRLEVAHLGVDVGSAHMSWIDTPLVQDARSDLRAFREMISLLPGPARKTTTVEKCGAAFVKGIEGRKRQINCPRWVGLMRWLRPMLATPAGEYHLRKHTGDLLRRMDAEVAQLGRSMSVRTEAVAKRSSGATPGEVS
jgi:NAD(P)-dependent dehydrogenase (short-subunit alcohol dehydrogenase family)